MANMETGEVVKDLSEVPEEQKKNYIPITVTEAAKMRAMKDPEERKKFIRKIHSDNIDIEERARIQYQARERTRKKNKLARTMRKKNRQ